MSGDKRPVILFYAVGLVHARNMKTLQQALPDYRLRALCRTSKPWFDSKEKLVALDVDSLPVSDDPIDPEVLKDNVRGVILSIALPDPWVIDLMEKANEMGVPVMAIEEVHQLAMTDGAVNNYLLPVDALLVASRFECEGFVAAGHPDDRVFATGWPFLTAPKNSTENVRSLLGIPMNRKVAVLVLSCSRELDGGSLETPEVRRRMMIAVAQGIDDSYCVVVKGHPNEPRSSVQKYVDELLPCAIVTDQDLPITDLLGASDLLISRGNSQVVVEALLADVPVCILPFGIRTVFDGTDAVCESGAELREKLRIGVFGKHQTAFFERHLHTTPAKALRGCARTIEEVIGSNSLRQKTTELIAYRNFMGHFCESDGLRIRQSGEFEAPVLEAIARLAERSADTHDMVALMERFQDHAILPYLQSTWVWQAAGKQDEIAASIEHCVFHAFPPKQNAGWFVDASIRLLQALSRFGFEDALRTLIGRIENVYGDHPKLSEAIAGLGLSR